jgi:hypothetical protein
MLNSEEVVKSAYEQAVRGIWQGDIQSARRFGVCTNDGDSCFPTVGYTCCTTSYLHYGSLKLYFFNRMH